MAAMAHDRRRGRTVLFGGVNGSATNDTWEWDGADWLPMTPAAAPPARERHAMAYDSARGIVLLFGGRNGTALGDTWQWDGRTWSARTPAASPPAQFEHAMAYDAARRVTVLFGNQRTWEWNGATWRERFPATRPPVPRGFRMTYDRGRGRVLLLGGRVASTAVAVVWEWSGSDWVAAGNLPVGLSDPGVAYDEPRRRLVVFGGADPTRTPRGDTHEWDRGSWATLAAPVLAEPAARRSHGLTTGPSGSGVLLFGGEVDTGGGRVSVRGDTWTWDGTQWQLETPSIAPPARSKFAAAFDAARDRVVVFGGRNASVAFGDTWEWDGSSWARRAAASGPAPRSESAMASDPGSARVLLFGGANGPSNDTWAWDGASWQPLSPGAAPGPRLRHAMAADPVRQRIVLFGGAYPGGLLNDTWEWDGTRWLRMAPPRSPPARDAHSLAFDPVRGRVVLFGGASGNGPLDDTWEWDGSRWIELITAVRPPAAKRHRTAWDPRGGSLLLFGGDSALPGAPLYGDGWRYRSAASGPYGLGCRGSAGVPALFAADGQAPALGTTMALWVEPVPAGSPPLFVAVGASNRAIGPLPLPLTLAGLGMPGCFLHQSNDFLLPTVGRGGRGSLFLHLPARRSLLGGHFYSQAFVLDPTANPTGMVATAGLDAQIGF